MKYQSQSRVHVGINTAHFEKSVAFYEALFGQAPTKRRDGYANFKVNDPAVNFTITTSDKVDGNQLSHMGIQVHQSQLVDLEKSRLEKLGLKTKLEKNSECCYALQDKVWVKDPDGNPWEVFVVLDQSEKKSGSGKCCS